MISFWNIKQVVVPFKGLCSTEPSYFAFGETLKSNWLARGYLRGEKERQPATGTPGQCRKPGTSPRAEPTLCRGPGFLLLCLAWHRPAVGRARSTAVPWASGNLRCPFLVGVFSQGDPQTTFSHAHHFIGVL